MKAKEIKDLFVAEAMRQFEKEGMATEENSTNRALAKIFAAALAHVLVTPSKRAR